jgi:hypothetical protein
MSIKKIALKPKRAAKNNPMENFLAIPLPLCCNGKDWRVPMKKLICLLVLLALTPGAHGDDKKKKKQPSAPHASAPGGGGGGQLPKMSRGNSGAHGMGQAGSGHNTSSPNTHGGTSATNRMNTHSASGGHSSNAMSGATGQAGGSTHNSNPLMRKNTQAGSNGQTSNPLSKKNQQAGTNNSNPLTKKNASQSAMNGRNTNPMTKGNNANNRAGVAQTGRAFNNRAGARNFQRAAHANYRVRNYRDVFHNYRPIRHDRFWYRAHYDRVVVVGGGYYYWDAGYWYPAWGYDPAFSFYVYDGPIYSYENLPPDQVIVNVQTELQDQGYYTGDVDGQLGPKTRDALAAYQSDHNLEITSAVDEPTVEALGLTGST